MSDIFLSYTRVKNRWGDVSDFHERLENYVQQKLGDVNLSVFMDREDIDPGDRWEKGLKEALDSARLLVVLLSPTWINSEECLKEYKHFRKFDENRTEFDDTRPVLPILWDEIHPELISTEEGQKILADLNSFQAASWLGARNIPWSEKGPRQTLDEIAKAIRAQLAPSGNNIA